MTNLNIEKISKEDAILKAMVTDLAWWFKEIIFPIKYLKELISVWIAYDGSSFQWINHINASDSILKWEIETLIQIPQEFADIEKPEYWIICSILWTNGKAHPNCARSKLVELQALLAKKWSWWNMYMWSEPEAFFVVSKDNVWNSDWWNKNYFNPKDPKAFIITKIQSVLDWMWFRIERAHTEVGEDQFEINWRFDKAERTADRIQMYKLIVHKIARKYWFDVTFLPKPYPNRNGSWMHCHISVQNDKANLFYNEKNKDKKYFSDEALKFLTWILENARSLAAIANRTEASYARLVPWFEAPCIIAIWDCNRSASCRIPAIADEKMKKVALRTEFRFPDPLANPYLLACWFISAWLDWIESNAKFKWFTDIDLYELSLKQLWEKWFKHLPRNLWEAYWEFTNNKALIKYLWTSIFESYEWLLLDEIDACQRYANSESMRRHYFA